MYRLGRPLGRRANHRRALAVILVVILLGLAVLYWFVIRKPDNQIKNSSTASVRTIKVSQPQTYQVNEPLFSMALPGPWREAARDFDARYHEIQWDYSDKKSAGRWVRIYVDGIPADFSVNYMLPVVVSGNQLQPQQVSDNCNTFTQGQTGQQIPAKWQDVSFLCDNIQTLHQVVGTGTKGNSYTITVTGDTKGTHRFFLAYEDDNIRPDFTLFANIISSFKAK